MKPHYFDDVDSLDRDSDVMLKMAIQQGYVPKDCRLGGMVIMALTTDGKDPCIGCECDRGLCHGRPKSEPHVDLGALPDMSRYEEPPPPRKREPVILGKIPY